MATISEIRAQYPQYSDMSDEQLGRALHKKYYSDIPWDSFVQRTGLKPNLKKENPAQYDPSSPQFQARFGTKPLNPGVAVPETLAHFGSSLLSFPVAGYTGLAAGAANLLGLGNESAGDAVERVRSALTYEPRSEGGRSLVEYAGVPGEYLARGANVAGDVLRRTPMLPSPYIPPEFAGTGAGPEAATIANVGLQAAPAVAAGGLTRGVGGARGRVGANQGRPSPATANAPRKAGLEDVPPTIEELGKQASAAYKRASDSGVSISESGLTRLKTSVVNNKEIRGRINEKLHPQASEAIRQITKTDGPITLDQLENLRRIANDARGAGKADGRLAGVVVEEIDDFLGTVRKQDIMGGNAAGISALQEARSLYSRKAKAEEIHRLIERAEVGRSKFSQSGLENALRNEFRALAKNDKKMRRFTPEEQAAIKRVAEGGPMANAARFIGKFLPTGVVSSLPTVLASSIGGMGVGVAVPVIGGAGRFAATRLTKANALRAEEVMRRGPTQRPARKRPRNALTDPLFGLTEKAE